MDSLLLGDDNILKDLGAERKIVRFIKLLRKLWIDECSRLKKDLNQALVSLDCAQKDQAESSISSI